MCNDLSDERTNLSFVTAAGPRQRNHSLVRFQWDSLPHFTILHSWFPQSGGPGPRVSQQQGGPVIPPGIGFFIRRLLRLARPRWRYSNPPPSCDVENEVKVKVKVQSMLLYDGRFTANQFALASSPLRPTTRGVFSDWTLAVTELLCDIISDERIGLALMNMPGLSSSVHFAHIACYWNSSFCTTHKSSVSRGFTEQIIPILRILCYNGSLDTWTVVSLITTKFKSLIYIYICMLKWSSTPPYRVSV
jgi:hypothetical protein